ncbi:MAG: sigma-70 family RNA polymerase sigma factor [Clostridia bacterium]|nr:sigma-70 family RNA polymerase sigma factor [Clostridia bacterium]
MLLFLMTIEDESDRNYVAQIYEQNKLKLYKIAYGIVKNHHDAEDCVQDVIIALIDYLETYRAASDVHQKNILFRMCRNIAIDKYRESNRKKSREANVQEIEGFELVDDERVDELFLKQENRQRLIDMINSLGDTYSDALYYFYYMQLSVQQIARMLSISEANVRMRLTRARRMLLANWEEELHELRSK